MHDVDEAAAAAENDQSLLTTLDEIRTGRHEDTDGSGANASYAHAFRDAGLDFAVISPADAGSKIRGRPAAVRLALATALDEWADVRSSLNDVAGAAARRNREGG